MSNSFTRATDQLATGSTSHHHQQPVPRSQQQQQQFGALHQLIAPEASGASAAAAAAAGTSTRYSFGVPLDTGAGVESFQRSSSGGSSTGSAYGGSGSLSVTGGPAMTRRMREFIPESKKDDEYWLKRQKNNEAAKRSREKRRANDAVMARRIHELASENKRLKLELGALRRQCGLPPLNTAPIIIPPMAESITSMSDDGQTMSPRPLDMLPVDSSATSLAPSSGDGCPAGVTSSGNTNSVNYVNYRSTDNNHSTSATASVSYATSSGRVLPPFAYDRCSTSGTLPPIANLYAPPSSSTNSETMRSHRILDRESEFSYSYDRRPIIAQNVLPQCETNTCQSADSASVIIFSDLSSSNDSDSYEYNGYRQTTNKPPKPSFGAGQPQAYNRSPPPLPSLTHEAPLNLTASSRQSSPQALSFRSGSLDFRVRSWQVKSEVMERDDSQLSCQGSNPAFTSGLESASITVACSGLEQQMQNSNRILFPPSRMQAATNFIDAPLFHRSSDPVALCLEPPSTRSLSHVAWQKQNTSNSMARKETTMVAQSPPESPVHESRHVRGGVPLKVWRKLAASRSDVVDDPQYGTGSEELHRVEHPSPRALAATVHRSASIEAERIHQQFYDRDNVSVAREARVMSQPHLSSSPRIIQRDPVRQLWRRPEEQEMLEALIQRRREAAAQANETASPPRASLSPM